MIIEYRDGKMIITHSTGVVDEYDVPYLQEIKATMLEMLAACQLNVDYIDNCIVKTEASIGNPHSINEGQPS